MARRGRKSKKGAVRLATIGSLKSVVEIMEFPNPLYLPAHSGEKWNPEKINAYANIKESALVVLEQRGKISKAQAMAGARFRSIWESLGGAGAGSFDYSREHVDGGGPRQAISDTQVAAGQELSACQKVLGIGYSVMVKVAGEGCAISDITPDQTMRRVYTHYLKEGLSALAVHWGYENRGSVRKTA